MDRQTLRDWAHRYNAEGVSGLFNRRPPDPPCLPSAAQKEELAEMVRAGPDPETDGVVRYLPRATPAISGATFSAPSARNGLKRPL